MSDKKCPLLYHQEPVPGKIAVRPSKAMRTLGDLGLAYTPGVAKVCQSIAQDPLMARHYTARNHTVAVISNGTAVLGLGNIGALASKPVMEGKAALFYRFGGVQSIDIEIDEQDPEKFIDIVHSLEPSFGAINLEDIKAPDCFKIESTLSEKMSIPVFHDDQHGTAVVVTAALLNALHLKNQSIESSKCVVLGAGSAAIACLKLLQSFGLKKENIFLCDSKGIVHTERTDLTPEKAMYARSTPLRTLKQALDGADILIGLSKPNIIAPEDIRNMAQQPIVFPLSNPEPEIAPHAIQSIHPDALIGTGQSGRPNQINNLLCFPYIFRGCLDAGAQKISEDMKKACVQALVQMARRGFSDSQNIYENKNQDFGAQYLIPYAFDPMLRIAVSKAVAEQALKERPQDVRHSFSMDDYHKKLAAESYADRPILGALIGQLPQKKQKIWYIINTNTVHDNVLNAAQYMERYGLASIGFVTKNTTVHQKIQSIKLLSQAPIVEHLPHACGDLRICIDDTHDHPTLIAFQQGGDLVFQAPHIPSPSMQKVLSCAGCTIEWDRIQDGILAQGKSCLFVRTHPQEHTKNTVIGPLNLCSDPGLQYARPNEDGISIIEKSCFVILEKMVA